MRVEKFDARAYSSTTTDPNACTISSSSSSSSLWRVLSTFSSSALLYATVIDTKRGRQSHSIVDYRSIIITIFILKREYSVGCLAHYSSFSFFSLLLLSFFLSSLFSLFLSLFSRVLLLLLKKRHNSKKNKIEEEEEEKERKKKKKKRKEERTLFKHHQQASNEKEAKKNFSTHYIELPGVSSGKEEEDNTVRLLLPR